MKIVPNSILFILVAFLVSAVSIASPSSGPPPPEPPPPGDSIDGNIILLLIVSIVYGIYKIYQLKLNKKTPI